MRDFEKRIMRLEDFVNRGRERWVVIQPDAIESAYDIARGERAIRSVEQARIMYPGQNLRFIEIRYGEQEELYAFR